MLNTLFPILYSAAVLILLWQAFRVMGRGFFNAQVPSTNRPNKKKSNEDRTGRITIHPELLDREGRITDEELLTVRFSEDNEPPQSTETSAE